MLSAEGVYANDSKLWIIQQLVDTTVTASAYKCTLTNTQIIDYRKMQYIHCNQFKLMCTLMGKN